MSSHRGDHARSRSAAPSRSTAPRRVPASAGILRRALRALGWALLVAGLLGAAVLLTFRLVTVIHTWHPLLIAASTFIPMLWIPLLVAGVGLMLVLRSWRRLLGAALVVVVGAVAAWPMLPGPARDEVPALEADGSLTVLSANVEYGQADVDALARLAEPRVDVLVIQEFTPDFEEELAAAGLLEQFPHTAGSAQEGAGGTMVLSRTPVELAARAEGTVFDNLVATTTVDGATWHLGAIHTAPPQLGADAWTQDAATVGELTAPPYTEENLLLVGDFNAIEQHHTMRELTADGTLRSLAASGHGRGEGLWEPTWPVNSRVPSFARIDHALAGAGVQGPVPSYIAVPGTDHKAMIVSASPGDGG